MKICDAIVEIEHPLGSKHPVYDFIFPVNYGFVKDIFEQIGEFQDAYVIGPQEGLEVFGGEVIARVIREGDPDEKWVVVEKGMRLSKEEIEKIIFFQEQWFLSEVVLNEEEK